MSEPKGIAPSPKLGGRPGETVGDCRSVDDWRDQDPGVSQDDIREPRRFDLVAHLHAQRVWSLQTFGPGPMEDSPARRAYCDAEDNADPTDLLEWIDVVLLAFDGAMRAGYEPEAVAAALAEKLRVNQGRRWPAPGSVPEGDAAEHEEGGE